MLTKLKGKITLKKSLVKIRGVLRNIKEINVGISTGATVNLQASVGILTQKAFAKNTWKQNVYSEGWTMFDKSGNLKHDV